jgi:hypothetical protein
LAAPADDLAQRRNAAKAQAELLKNKQSSDRVFAHCVLATMASAQRLIVTSWRLECNLERTAAPMRSIMSRRECD